MAIYGGIDLGTTYTSISYYDENRADVETIDLVESADGLKTLRSVVYYPEPGETPVAGSSAWNAYRQFPDRVVVGIKRLMGTSFALNIDGVDLTPQLISAEILKTVMRDAESFLGEGISDVVIAVPAYFGIAELTATEEAGRLAGLNVLGLLQEPHAVALAYFMEKVIDILDRYLLVFDLGGASFNVTLIQPTMFQDALNQFSLKCETLCIDGDRHLGGDDWDRTLAQIVADKVQAQFEVDIMLDPENEQILLHNCEKAKRDLSRINKVEITADALGHQVTVTRSEFESATADLLCMTEVLLEQVLANTEARHGINKQDIDVVLAGGSSKMPMVKQMIERVMGKPPFTHKNPELLVTKGAAYWAYLLQEDATILSNLQSPKPAMDIVHSIPSYSPQFRPEVPLEVDRVHFTVTAPPMVFPGAMFVVDIWAHLEQQRQEVIQRARDALGNKEILVKTKGPLPITRGTILTVNLRIDDLLIEDPQDTIIWEGEIGNADFAVAVPQDISPGARIGKVTIYADTVQIARVNFELVVGPRFSDDQTLAKAKPLPVQEIHNRSAFASYASPDRDEVLHCILGMQKAAPKMDIFMDVHSLRSGQNWEKELWARIPTCDVFFLFWSANARQSPWVEKEWRCALTARGIDFIDPVPLQPPEVAPPPPELASLHFNDWQLAYLRNAHKPV